MKQRQFYAVLMTTLLALASPFSASGQNQVNGLVTKIYHDHFYKYDTVTNMPWDCGGNSYDLYLQLQKAQAIEGSAAYIVHAFYEKGSWSDGSWKPASRLLIPVNPRAGQPRWAFHAALVVDGLVFDQYYSKQPMVFDFTQYIPEMWGNGTQDALKFQLIPATRYHEVVRTGYAVDENEFPIMTYEQILQVIAR